MRRSQFVLRVAGPTLFVSALLLGACSAAALYLHLRQAATAEALGENVGSRRVARLLELALSERIALARRGEDRGAGLDAQLRSLLADARALADKPEERQLLVLLDASYGRFARAWADLPDAARESGGPAVDPAATILEREAWPTSSRLRDLNGQLVEASVKAHLRATRRMAWGLVGVGLVGSVAGLLLGHGMARGLGRSVHQLSIQIRDAAGKLGRDLPAVVVDEEGDLHRLPGRMSQVVGEIERVVGQLQQREREVLRAEQLAAVGQLAAGVAHEIRNPLTAIKMLVQAQAEEARASGLPADDLEVIEQEIRRIERRIQAFLDFARPPRPGSQVLDLSGAIEQALALVGGRARKQGVAVEFRKPDAPVAVEADGDQIGQLLVNLAMNALDAMPSGGRLTVELRPPSGGRAELHVADTGPGIAPEVLPRLFEPFASGKEAGTGLGLAISRRIAEGHGGSLHVAQPAGGGARFVLRLPARADGSYRPGDQAESSRGGPA